MQCNGKAAFELIFELEEFLRTLHDCVILWPVFVSPEWNLENLLLSSSGRSINVIKDEINCPQEKKVPTVYLLHGHYKSTRVIAFAREPPHK